MTSSLFCDRCGAALSPQTPLCPECGEEQRQLLPGSLLLQRYQIQEKVGQGGFGSVYKAWDMLRKRTVALKQIPLANLSTREMIEATDSYNREITLLSRLQHRNLLEIYDHCTDPEHWYIIMQYIHGRTLEEILSTAHHGRLSVAEVVFIGAQLCDVLGYLHAQEPPIIFRDVKPANVMIARGHLYLIDFGIARRYRPGQAKDTGPLGSPGYAAPEQYGAGQSTHRTDVYGLGATLQTLLTGKEPQEIQAAGFPVDCEIPAVIQRLLASMMERDPTRRPASLWTIGRGLRTLQKQYPLSQDSYAHAPFAWLATLWILCMLAIPPLLFSYGLFLLFPLALAGTALLWLALLHRYHTSEGMFGVQKQKKAGRRLLKEALGRSLFWVWQCFLCECLLLVGLLLKFFDLHQFLLLILYAAVSLAGNLVLHSRWLHRLRQTGQTSSPVPAQHATQESHMQQQIQKRP